MAWQAATIATCKQIRLAVVMRMNWKAYLSGYIRSAISIPGQYERKAASAVSNTRPKFMA